MLVHSKCLGDDRKLLQRRVNLFLAILQVFEGIKSLLVCHKTGAWWMSCSLFFHHLSDVVIFSLLVIFVNVFGHFAIVLVDFDFFLFFVFLLLGLLDFLSLGVVQDHFHHVVLDGVAVIAIIQFSLLVGTRNSLLPEVHSRKVDGLRGVALQWLSSLSRSSIHLDYWRSIFFDLLQMLISLLLIGEIYSPERVL